MAKAAVATPFRFDSTAPSAQRVAERQAARFVTNVSTETRQALRALVVRSIREGIPVLDAARLIRGMVGLTTQQGQAVMNYRAELVASGLSPARVASLVERYADKLLKVRAMNIARWEIMDALGTGQRESWRQAQAKGLLGKGARKGLVLTPDERLCIVCRQLEHVTVPLDADFKTMLGPRPGAPIHIRCRCANVITNPG